jgi:hypothetical protein
MRARLNCTLPSAPLRALFDRHGAAEISEVRRQHHAWQREATKELAAVRSAALQRYEQAGMVHAHTPGTDAKGALVVGWDAAQRAEPERAQVILASDQCSSSRSIEQVHAPAKAASYAGAAPRAEHARLSPARRM